MKKTRHVVLMLVLWCALWPMSGQAAETVRFATQEYVNYAEPKGKGYYLALLRAVFPSPAYKLEIDWVPFERSLQMVKAGTAHVVSGVGHTEQGIVLSQYSTDLDVVDVAYKKGHFSRWQGLETLDGKKVVAQIGYKFNNYVPSLKMNYEEKPNLDGMLKMVVAERVDAVLDYEEEIGKAAKALGLEGQIEIQPSGISKPLYFGFANTEQGRKLLQQFDTEVAKLRASGQLKAMFIAETHKPRAFPGF